MLITARWRRWSAFPKRLDPVAASVRAAALLALLSAFTSVASAETSAQTLYLLQCSGCHGPDGSGDPRVGVPYTLTSIAAVALGGVALNGGRGGMLGSAAAGALLFLIQTLFTLAQVSIFYIQIMYGLILFVALTLNAAGERARRGRMAEQAG